MDTTSKDALANISTIGGITISMSHVETSITILVLLTALVLNITRIYDWWVKRR